MLPKNWDDITLEQYTAFKKTLKEEPSGEDGELNLVIKQISFLTGLDPDYVEDNISASDVAKMHELIKTPLPTVITKRFRFNNKSYVADLNPTDSKRYRGGRYMSVMNTLKDKHIDNDHKLLFQVCREVTWYGKTIEPDLNTIAEQIESFKQLPLKIANPIKVFFCSLSESLTDATLQYLTNKAKTATKQLQTEIDYLNGSAG